MSVTTNAWLIRLTVCTVLGSPIVSRCPRPPFTGNLLEVQGATAQPLDGGQLHEHHRSDDHLGAIAALLARAYLRLTQKRRNRGLSRPGGSQKSLDVSRPESPHVGTESTSEEPRWTSP